LIAFCHVQRPAGLSNLTECYWPLTGENGEAVNIDKEKLSPEERAKFDVGWKNNEFNEYASNMISLHRSLPDVRHKEYVEAVSFLTLVHLCSLAT
jgi:hypothetical protein